MHMDTTKPQLSFKQEQLLENNWFGYIIVVVTCEDCRYMIDPVEFI